MTFKKLMLAVAAISMTAAPVMAANPAASLSIAPASARASAEQGDSQLGGSFLLIGLAVVAVIVGIVVLSDGDDSKSP